MAAVVEERPLVEDRHYIPPPETGEPPKRISKKKAAKIAEQQRKAAKEARRQEKKLAKKQSKAAKKAAKKARKAQRKAEKAAYREAHPRTKKRGWFKRTVSWTKRKFKNGARRVRRTFRRAWSSTRKTGRRMWSGMKHAGKTMVGWTKNVGRTIWAGASTLGKSLYSVGLWLAKVPAKWILTVPMKLLSGFAGGGALGTGLSYLAGTPLIALTGVLIMVGGIAGLIAMGGKSKPKQIKAKKAKPTEQVKPKPSAYDNGDVVKGDVVESAILTEEDEYANPDIVVADGPKVEGDEIVPDTGPRVEAAMLLSEPARRHLIEREGELTNTVKDNDWPADRESTMWGQIYAIRACQRARLSDGWPSIASVDRMMRSELAKEVEAGWNWTMAKKGITQELTRIKNTPEVEPALS